MMSWDDALLEHDANARDMWNNAWVYVGPCAPASQEELMEVEAIMEGEAIMEEEEEMEEDALLVDETPMFEEAPSDLRRLRG